MFCPNCGQQQVSQEIKFCSRCGFPMGLISEILAHGGFLPQLADLYKSKTFLQNRKRVDFRFNLVFVLVFFNAPLLAIAGGEDIVALAAILGFVGGMIIVILSAFFLKNVPKNLPDNLLQNALKVETVPAHLHGNQFQTALPPQQTQSAHSYVAPANSWKSADTGELVRPNSVTEETTKLLKKDE